MDPVVVFFERASMALAGHKIAFCFLFERGFILIYTIYIRFLPEFPVG